MPFSRKETKRFSVSVGPGETATASTTLDYDATVEEIDVRIYQGAENEIGVVPYRIRDADQLTLVDLIGKSKIYGDGDYWTFNVAESVEEGDEIGIEVEHEADSYQFDVDVDVTLDQAGGASRVLSAISGVFS
ncbi:hypothetical protein [Natrinema versiforme]|uniref:Uncharacterized protein n=1 Tax=Natrinema versiforme JCM 10478 TaxID=1227496 RepID=L9Y5I2_9EURY|nr:hypothetical protein [Natrinema versiforme]ELY69330.1 hypothetical protein C489_05233 [Natrinema versiforme JCM 10478]